MSWARGVTLCCCSVTQLCLTLCSPMDCSTPGFPVLHYLLETAQTPVHQVSDASNHLILCFPLLLPSIFPRIRVLSNESALCIRWPKYWSFSFSISPSKEYSGLISFRIDWFDLLAVQGTLKSLLQHHILKASILWCLVFFMVQLSYPYLTIGKTIAVSHNVYLCICVCVCVCLSTHQVHSCCCRWQIFILFMDDIFICFYDMGNFGNFLLVEELCIYNVLS